MSKPNWCDTETELRSKFYAVPWKVILICWFPNKFYWFSEALRQFCHLTERRKITKALSINKVNPSNHCDLHNHWRSGGTPCEVMWPPVKTWWLLKLNENFVSWRIYFRIKSQLFLFLPILIFTRTVALLLKRYLKMIFSAWCAISGLLIPVGQNKVSHATCFRDPIPWQQISRTSIRQAD